MVGKYESFYKIRHGDLRAEMNEKYLMSLRGTATQVWRYIDEYAAKAGNPFASKDWASLLRLRSLAMSNSGVQRDDIENINHFLRTAAAISREKWVNFCLWKMVLGILLLVCPLVISIKIMAHSKRSWYVCAVQWLSCQNCAYLVLSSSDYAGGRECSKWRRCVL